MVWYPVGPRARIRILLLLAVLAWPLMVPASASAGVTTVSGTVRDLLGDPIADAQVSHDYGSVFTDVNGQFTIDKPSVLGTFALTAGSGRFVDQTRLVDAVLDDVVDFDLEYRLSAGVPDPYVSPALDTEVVIRIETGAPAPGPGNGDTCVRLTDHRDGAVYDAFWAGEVEFEETIWEVALPVTEADLDGTYQTEAVVEECTSGQHVSPVASAGYVIDGTVPRVWSSSTLPSDGGNAVHADVRPVSRITDSPFGAGVDWASAVLEVIRADGSIAYSYSGASVIVDSSSGTIEAATATNLVVGGVYRLRVTVSDLAGNVAVYEHAEMSQGGGFVVTTASYGSAIAEIPPIACDLGDPDGGLRAVVCDGAILDVSGATVELGESRHPGTGEVGHSVSLEGIVVETADGALSESAYDPGDPAYADQSVVATFKVGASESAQSVTTTALSFELGVLTTLVPDSWDSAVIRMEPTATSVVPATCSTPADGCRVDPVAIPEQTLLGFGQIEGVIDGSEVSSTLSGGWTLWNPDGSVADATELVPESSTQVTSEDGPYAPCERSPQPTKEWEPQVMNIHALDPSSYGEMFLHKAMWYKAKNYAEGWRDRYSFCSEGGATAAYRGAHLDAVGFGISINDTVSRKPGTPDWAEGVDQATPASSLTIAAQIGPVTVSATTPNTAIKSRNTGHNAPVAPWWLTGQDFDNHERWNYEANGWWAWWERRCTTSWWVFTDCHPSYDWQSTNGESFYDVPTGATVGYLWKVGVRSKCEGQIVWDEDENTKVCIPGPFYAY